MKIKPNDTCVLMFSGGRDSTISAVRLSKRFDRLVLVTVLSEHLVGVERVHRRIGELKKLLNKETEWLHIVQPKPPVSETLISATCLPCQRSYVCIGIIIAHRYHIANLAMGYSGYQNTWPEQTPYATDRLRDLLHGIGIRLLLPAYGIRSKDEAMDELERAGLAQESYEQKCLKQSTNIDIDGDLLRAEVDRWIESISESIRQKDSFPITVRYRGRIGGTTPAPVSPER